MLRDVTLADFGPAAARAPRYFTVGTELNARDSSSFNMGVMLMNLRGLRQTHGAFVAHAFSDAAVADGLMYGRYGVVDQGALASFYEGKFATVILPLFNWKP